MTLTAERLRELLHYDPETGIFRRRARIMSRDRPSSMAGRITGNKPVHYGYGQIGVDNVVYQAHRLAWLYTHGRWPADEIDHINLDRLDNRLINLREATREQNGRNLKKSKANKTGLKGVSRHHDGRYSAQIHLRRKKHHLGLFDCKAAAHFAYVVASDKLHKEFGRVA